MLVLAVTSKPVMRVTQRTIPDLSWLTRRCPPIIFICPHFLMSTPFITPTTKWSKTPTLSTKRRRRGVKEDATMDSRSLRMSSAGGDASHSFVLKIDQEEIKDNFGEHTTWHRLQDFAFIESLDAEYGAFSPHNIYNVCNPQLATDFMVEQCGVWPKQIKYFSSSGKTTQYLLFFDSNDKEKILWKLPRGWTKLGRRLGCHLFYPGEK